MNKIHKKVVEELYKPIRINFERRRYELKGLNDLIEIDIADMQLLSDHNEGFKYILVASNPFSKRIFTVPMKNKNSKTVVEATKQILARSRTKYKNLHTDRGSEFTNKLFQKEIVRTHGINHYYSYGVKKCAFVERAIKTLKIKLYQKMGLKGKEEWISELKPLTDVINKTKHSRYKFAPNEVTKKNEKEILKKFYSKPRPYAMSRHKVGDKVRISEPALTFRRSFYPSWSPQVYAIAKINYKKPVTYQLINYKGEKLKRSFYGEEIMKTDHPEYYLIEKIVRKKGKRLLVRWWGFDENDDTWINEKDYNSRESEI
jgi:Integrase core domain